MVSLCTMQLQILDQAHHEPTVYKWLAVVLGAHTALNVGCTHCTQCTSCGLHTLHKLHTLHTLHTLH